MATTSAFEIDTKNTCIFCLESCPSNNGTAVIGADACSRASLKFLLRHLEIDVFQLNLGVDASRRVESVEVKATLCEVCRAAVADFCRVFHEFEKIRMKLSDSLVTISKRIQEENGNEERVDRLDRGLRVELRSAESLAEKLRKATLEKCLHRGRVTIPRVILNQFVQGDSLSNGTGDGVAPPLTAENGDNQSATAQKSTDNGDFTSEARRRAHSNLPRRERPSKEKNVVVKRKPGRPKGRRNKNFVTSEVVRKESLPSTQAAKSRSRPTSKESFGSLQENEEINQLSNNTGANPAAPQSTIGSSVRTSNGKRGLHRSSFGGQRKRVECRLCGKQLLNLSGHMAVHSRARPFPCQLCPKTFKRRYDLLSHIRTHTNERPFSCGVCKSSFRENGHLKAHMRWIHSETREFPCPLCPKAFKFKVDVVKHVRTHTKEKPFLCVVCKKEFSQFSNLREHQKLKHGIIIDRPNNY